MMRRLGTLSVIAILSLSMAPVWAGDLFVYPAKGQSKDQTEKDKYACYQFAKDQSGFDPMARPTTSTPPPAKEKETWGAGQGAVGGALLGAGVGALAGGRSGAGTGAIVGGVGGGAMGHMRRSDQKTREETRRRDWEQRETSRYATGRNNYERAYAACLEGRGYTVR